MASVFALATALLATAAPPGGALAHPHPSAAGDHDKAEVKADVKTDGSGIRWVHDDWPAARRTALDAHQLVAVDVWATWCHSCLSMKNFVLTAAPLAAVAKQHTWLALDADRPENAGFFSRFPVTAFPTFLVVDPANETIVARWVGTGTPEQMRAFFASAERSADDPVTRGQRALAREDFAEARRVFEAALAHGVADPALRTRLLDGYIEALSNLPPEVEVKSGAAPSPQRAGSQRKDDGPARTCAEIGAKHMGEVEDTAPGMDFVGTVATCATSAPEPVRTQVLQSVVRRLEPVTQHFSPDLSADDRSGVYEALAEAYNALGRADDARRATEARAHMLDEAAARARTAEERATFDAHRLDCDIKLGRFAEAEKMLLASETALSGDFNPPYRLAVLYLAQGRTADGLAAIDRALARGYGGRKIRLFATKVDLLIQAKRWDAARKTIAEAREEIRKISPAQVRPSWVKELDARQDKVAALQKAAS